MATLEVCANSLQSAVNAEIGGAHLVELCQNLEAGGITPSFGLIARVKQTVKIPINVLIRPRTGDFVYNDDEFQIMLVDIQACKQLACEGVVIGILTPDNCVDVPRVSQLVRAAKPMSVTFHRAFDDCDDQFQALADVIQTGCDKILTSGGESSAVAGTARLSRLVKIARDRIVIMPGSGITAHNIESLVKSVGAREYHTSAKVNVPSTRTSMFQATQLQTDAGQVSQLVKHLNSQ